MHLPNEVELPNQCLDDNRKRIFHGGVYSWQPQNGHSSDNLFAYLIVIMGTATGLLISAFVPPDGWDCRHIGEVLVLIAWLLSALIDIWIRYLWPLNREKQTEDSKKKNQDKLYWSTGLKDVLATIATTGVVVTTQLGLFNRCQCYTSWGKTGLALPEMPDTAQTLFHRLTTVYPAIAFTSIGIHLVLVPLFISVQYKDALRTFVQRDDRRSNAPWLWKFLKWYQTFVQRDDRRSNALWLWKILKWYRTSKAAIQSTFPRNRFRLSRGNRANTMSTEEGHRGNPHELQPQTSQVSVPGSAAPGNDHGDGTSVADGQSELTDVVPGSSAVDWPSRSGTNLPSTADPRRMNTFDEESGSILRR